MRKLDGCLCANCGDLDYHTYKQAQLLQKNEAAVRKFQKTKAGGLLPSRAAYRRSCYPGLPIIWFAILLDR